MTAANKVYRKEDIIGQAHSMSSQPVNKGWGKGGAAVYNIWLYKGGGNCHHRWYRRIYKTKFGEGKPNVNTDSVISVAKARSAGFKPEPHKKSERGVSIAPKRRADKGFVRK